MRWAIFYGDGSTFTDEDGNPDEAPSLNIQAIAFEDPLTGHTVASGKDFYWFDNNRWIGGDVFGLWDYLQRTGAVKFGRTISDSEYGRILERACAEGLPPKSAKRVGER